VNPSKENNMATKKQVPTLDWMGTVTSNDGKTMVIDLPNFGGTNKGRTERIDLTGKLPEGLTGKEPVGTRVELLSVEVFSE
jgi:hypothetical protein